MVGCGWLRDQTVMRHGAECVAELALTAIGFSDSAQHLFDVLAATCKSRLMALLALNASAHVVCLPSDGAERQCR